MGKAVYCASHAPDRTVMFWLNWTTCKVCLRWPNPLLCAGCRQRWGRLAMRCPHCADHAHAGPCEGQHLHLWTEAAARMDYGSPCDQWIKRLKFGGDWTQARDLARLLNECPHARHLRAQADLILPVPVSDQRLRERGYNQAALLAQHWCGKDPRLRIDWLRKQRHTPSQAMSDRSQRLLQLQGTLGWSGSAQPQALRGARVLVIDDVMTTGATLDVATRSLLQAGAARVDVTVFARTTGSLAPQPPSPGP
jgi:ComF family protein